MKKPVILTGLLTLFPGIALAQEPALNGANTAWILTSTALVLFMTLPGLALFYGGLVRTKNVLSVLMQCFAIAGVVSILWLVVGYSLAFGEGGPLIGDFSKVMMADIGRETLSGDIPESLFMLFQMTFAIITPALIVGGFAERMKFSAMLLFSAFWLLLVYVPIGHWVWGGGWLGAMGLYDFAGGTVVHISAGVAALVAALVMGRRRGFPKTAMPPHNMTMTIAGDRSAAALTMPDAITAVPPSIRDAALGLGAVPILLEPACYYTSVLLVFGLLWTRREIVGAALCALSAVLWAIAAAWFSVTAPEVGGLDALISAPALDGKLAFFPQLVAGPIERAANLLPQLQRERSVTRDDLANLDEKAAIEKLAARIGAMPWWVISTAVQKTRYLSVGESLGVDLGLAHVEVPVADDHGIGDVEPGDHRHGLDRLAVLNDNPYDARLPFASGLVVGHQQVARRLQGQPFRADVDRPPGNDDVGRSEDPHQFGGGEPQFGQARVPVLDEDPLLLGSADLDLGHVVEAQELVAHLVGQVLELGVVETISRNAYDRPEHVTELVVHQRADGPGGQVPGGLLDLAPEVVPDWPRLLELRLQVDEDQGHAGAGIAVDEIQLGNLLHDLLDLVGDQLFDPRRAGAGEVGHHDRHPDDEAGVLRP